jgi:hypothetical protein
VSDPGSTQATELTPADAPTLADETEIVMVHASRVVGPYEDAWDLLRAELSAMPRDVMPVTGPSPSELTDEEILAAIDRVLTEYEAERAVAVPASTCQDHMSNPSSTETTKPTVRSETEAYAAISPRGGHVIMATIAPTADAAWARLRKSVSEPDTLYDRGWRTGRLRCQLVEVMP